MTTKSNLSANGLAYTGPKTPVNEDMWLLQWEVDDFIQFRNNRTAYLRKRFPTLEVLPNLDEFYKTIFSDTLLDFKDRYVIFTSVDFTVIYHMDHFLIWRNLEAYCDVSVLDRPPPTDSMKTTESNLLPPTDIMKTTESNLSANGLAYTGTEFYVENGRRYIQWETFDYALLAHNRTAYLREKFPTIEVILTIDRFYKALFSGGTYDVKDKYEIFTNKSFTLIFHKENAVYWSHLEADCDFSRLDNP